MIETLEAKQSFELFARNHGVIVCHYHADNGRFADLGWLNEIRKEGQTQTFYGVNAHHQNGVAEKLKKLVGFHKVQEEQETTLRFQLVVSIWTSQ